MSALVDWQTPLPGAHEPRWSSGAARSASAFTIDCSQYAMDDSDLNPNGELAQRMNAMFDEGGLVHLTETGLHDLSTMRLFAKLVLQKPMRYEGGSNSRGDLAPNVYEVGAPLSAWLHYHHEMAYIGHSTQMLAFLCKSALPDRGYTFLSDNLQATEAILETEFGRKLKALGLCYHRNLTDREAFIGTEELGVYNHWQKSMLTDDPDEAIEKARAKGLHAEWGPNRLLKTRYYISAFEYFSPLDRNLLFSSVADDAMWFDSWPKVMHLPHDERPLKLTFGDDSEMSEAEKHLFVDIYDRFGFPIPWKQGAIAVVCNYRYAHGRPAIHLDSGESRELGVIVGDGFERVGDVAGKW
jgi:hypothetical protein